MPFLTQECEHTQLNFSSWRHVRVQLLGLYAYDFVTISCGSTQLTKIVQQCSVYKTYCSHGVDFCSQRRQQTSARAGQRHARLAAAAAAAVAVATVQHHHLLLGSQQHHYYSVTKLQL
jgi:hypothetical protein